MANIYSAFGITGITPAFLDPSGRCYVHHVYVGGSDWQTEIYKDSANTVLIGHTAEYTTTGAKAIVADGGSGLGGTITVETLSATVEESEGVALEWYRYAIVADITAILLTLHGPDINVGTVTAMWRAPSGSHVVHHPFFLPGAYAEGTAMQAVRDVAKHTPYWLHKRAHLCRFGVAASGKNVTAAPRINVYIVGGGSSLTGSGDGPQVAGAATNVVWDDNIDPAKAIAAYGSEIDIAVTTTQNSADDLNLSVLTQWVIE